MSISSILIRWYLQKKRNLPWRTSVNPYEIWVSEIILQQTRVAQGLGYYQRFLSRFPTVESLANADTEEVLKVWQGLGYYSRARNLHAGAKYVLQQLSGEFPSTYDGLMKIKGIGDYTASAVGSFAFNLPLPVIDGNVSRVISRLYGIHDPINTSAGHQNIKKMADKILDKENPGTHNQAIMEFGALQCTVHNPDCIICPLRQDCHAFVHQEVDILPVKLKQQKIRDRYFNYLVLLYHNNIYIRKRLEKDIWHGLYDFPVIETDTKVAEQELLASTAWKTIFQHTDAVLLNVSQEYIHQLSHQKIHARFYMVNIDGKPDLPENETLMIEKKNIHRYPVPRLIEKYLEILIIFTIPKNEQNGK